MGDHPSLFVLCVHTRGGGKRKPLHINVSNVPYLCVSFLVLSCIIPRLILYVTFRASSATIIPSLLSLFTHIVIHHCRIVCHNSCSIPECTQCTFLLQVYRLLLQFCSRSHKYSRLFICLYSPLKLCCSVSSLLHSNVLSRGPIGLLLHMEW